jgi:hypothetical protein
VTIAEEKLLKSGIKSSVRTSLRGPHNISSTIDFFSCMGITLHVTTRHPTLLASKEEGHGLAWKSLKILAALDHLSMPSQALVIPQRASDGPKGDVKSAANEALPLSTTTTSASAAFARSLLIFLGKPLLCLGLQTLYTADLQVSCSADRQSFSGRIEVGAHVIRRA